MSSEEVKGKIILATINCIEQNGVQAVTIRKIAEMAKVNVAAVNYHFGSKENLIKLALDQTLKEAFVVNVDDHFDGNRDISGALEDYFRTTLEGAINYPGITKAHLYDPFINNNYNGTFAEKFKIFLEDLQSRIKPLFPDKSEGDIMIIVIQMFSAIFLPGILPGLFNKFPEMDFINPQKREKYITLLLERYL
ncbi:MAG: TetR/AcrR family transcriptional regulator [Candidatus Cloacimonetes bacterium]|nr:TetR/AcrR family transcriptional regulator [Candidatus Cloacimonadota bacterium]